MSSQVGSTYGTWFEFEATGTRIYAGSGSPEGVQTGSVGDLYVRSDMSASNPPLYFKLSGTATATGWVALNIQAASPVTGQPGTASLGLVGNTQPELVVA